MNLRVAVDFGTSSTCVVASLQGREPQMVVIDGHPLLPSAVYAAPDGTLFVGQEAERQAAVDPARYEPHPKRRIDEGELLLGASVLPVRDVVHAVLRRAVAEARRFAGGAEVGLLVLTHPADWGVVRTRVLRQAASGLARDVALVPEPVAAAVFHAAASGAAGADSTLAVLDLGGGTVDVSVVRRNGVQGPAHAARGGFRVLATKGDPRFGGADIDQALLEHVGSLASGTDPDAWRALMDGRELADRRRRRVLRQDVRGAKETLSRHAYTDVPMPPPFADAHVTRESLERIIAGPLGRAVDLTSATIAQAGLGPRQLAGIFLVGGSSRIPMISRLVHERIGIVPTTLDQPETVVARGAMRTVLSEPHRSVRPPGHPMPAGPQPQPMPVRPAPRNLAASVSQVEPSRGRGKLAWLVGGAFALIGAVAVGLVLLLGDPEPEGHRLAQYDYEFLRPLDWVHTGGVVEQRKVVVRPEGSPSGDDLVVVQEFPLTFDATADRDRLVRELRAQIESAGPAFADLEPDANFGERQVVRYVQHGDGTTVDWYVLAEKQVQISVGCQYTDGGVDRVRAACEQIVRTLRITG